MDEPDRTTPGSTLAPAPGDAPLQSPAGMIPIPAQRQPCPTCGGASAAQEIPTTPFSSSAWVYAIGRIDARFPTIAVEKEYHQAAARVPSTSGLTEHQLRFQVLSREENRYL